MEKTGKPLRITLKRSLLYSRLQRAYRGFPELVLPNLTQHRIGKCNICGWSTIFLTTLPEKRRESLICLFCHSSSRNRHVAKMILSQMPRESTSLWEAGKRTRLRIYDTNRHGPIFWVLHDVPTCFCSFLTGANHPGDRIAGQLLCQDLEELAFPNNSIDVVITEDVLEHVRDYGRALGEIQRVLKTGGFHAFTVPFRGEATTLKRVDTSGNEDVLLLPPEYHLDSDERQVLAYRTFGSDLLDQLDSLGFETTVDCSNDSRAGIFDSCAFLSRKVRP